MRGSFPLAALAVLLSLSCSLMSLEGDRLFEANRLQEAADSYTRYLDRHPARTPRADRALYHLGLIYALPESPLYDLELAEDTLRTLARMEDAGLYARQAALILALQVEASGLREEETRQRALAARLEDELRRLEEKAEQASSAAGEHEDRARRLSSRVQQLRTEIDRLTTALEKRSEELERIKEIDLGRMPRDRHEGSRR